jgi:hypothetical protein
MASLALIVAAGGLIQYREPLLLKFGLESWDPEYYRAVDLAKSGRSLQRYHTNYFTIQQRTRLEGGEIDPDGWKAVREDPVSFLVTYRGKVGTRVVEYDFEVDVALREVTVRRDDPGRPDGVPDAPTGAEVFEGSDGAPGAPPGAAR